MIRKGNMIAILLMFCIIILFLQFRKDHNLRNKIANLTDEWIKQTTSKSMGKFCGDAVLLGTVSRVIRKDKDVEKYFDYFSNLPNLRALKKNYEISKISDNVYMNNAIIEWSWGTNIKSKVLARMTFVFRGNCIVLLHSSKLPQYNADLFKVSGKK